MDWTTRFRSHSQSLNVEPLDLRPQDARISPPMPSKKPEREFRVRENLRAGNTVDATIRAVIPQTDGLRLQVDFGFEQTALIHVWQVVDD